jgi:type 1 glutamine amidotransferase
MGTLTAEHMEPIAKAVENGTGVAGCHGGMCDAFRVNPLWQFITGGQWVAHPGNDNVRYTVNIRDQSHPIMQGIGDFEVSSEQYYMHIDPAIKVLASTHFPTAPGPHTPNGPLEMPVVWTKFYGKGKVFYSSLGHSAAIVEAEPHLTILKRGCRWAAGKGE